MPEIVSKRHGPGSIATGTAALPLDQEGQSQVAQLAQQFKAKGGLDLIISSDLPRAVETAEAIVKATGAKLITTELLHPWRLGPLEGQPDKEVKPQIVKLAKEQPDQALEGMSEVSTKPGESFNGAVNRTIPFLQFIADMHRLLPKLRIGVLTHSKVIDMAMSTQNGKTDVDEMYKRETSVGDVYGADGRKIDMASADPIQPEVHLIRHGHTQWDQDAGTEARF